jgi:hypothetical protein
VAENPPTTDLEGKTFKGKIQSTFGQILIQLVLLQQTADPANDELVK